MALPEAFYRRSPEPGRFVATELTRGPWSVEHQHGGPPAALLTSALEREGADMALWRVARVTVEMLRPVRIGPVRVQVSALRRGGKVQWLEAALLDDAGVLLSRATGVRVRRAELALPPAKDPPPAPLVPPEQLEPFRFPFFPTEIGYHRAVEVRIARGRWAKEPTAAWLRPLVPLVEGERDTPLAPVVVTADAANGVALVLDPARFVFINPDLTITVSRDPIGDWIGLDTHAMADPGGGGVCHAGLHDRAGALGYSLQSLLVEAR